MKNSKYKPHASGLVEKRCKLCKTMVSKVDVTKNVICWKCTHLMSEGYTDVEIKIIYKHEKSRFCK